MTPTCCAAIWPASVTLTVPSLPMVMEVAPVGMVIAGFHRISVGGYHVAIRVQLKSAATGVRGFSRGERDLKKTLALNRQVQGIAGGAEVALGLDNFGRR